MSNPLTQIAKLREAKGMTQAELARAIDSGVYNVRNLEKK
ncbi:MAG: helix-turn-helix domain-containing protein [Xenococcus sp. (in: cyanobacteria)]